MANTIILAAPVGVYPAAQVCLNKSDQGFGDWFMPAICELGRYVGLGTDEGCGNTNPNFYTTLHTNNLGAFVNGIYWSSSQFSGCPMFDCGSLQIFTDGFQGGDGKMAFHRLRCARAFIQLQSVNAV